MMRILKPSVTAVLSALALFLSCDSPTGPGPAPDRIESLPRALTEAETEVITASNDFAFRLLEEVRADTPPGENVFISPLSVSMALGMAANGARGETFDAMRSTLGVGDMTRERMNGAYRGLLDLLLPLDRQVELGIANSAWIRQGFPILPSFLERIESSFDAETRVLDFADPGAKDIVNGWVSDKTRGRIRTILDGISVDDILYLINAVYFKGSWRSGFDPANTRDGAFQLDDGSTVDVPFMFQDDMGVLAYAGDGVSVVDLAYGGEAFSMVFVEPSSGTLTDLLDTLTPERWDGWMAGLGENGFQVRIPKFEMEFNADLKPPLRRMGMGVAFDHGKADFWDLADTYDRIFIDRVKHKTFVAIDEEGTEAAAVTFIGFRVISTGPITFSIDRPFLIAIRERLSGTLLFLGAVYDPR